jgi:hypothetical protein
MRQKQLRVEHPPSTSPTLGPRQGDEVILSCIVGHRQRQQEVTVGAREPWKLAQLVVDPLSIHDHHLACLPARRLPCFGSGTPMRRNGQYRVHQNQKTVAQQEVRNSGEKCAEMRGLTRSHAPRCEGAHPRMKSEGRTDRPP